MTFSADWLALRQPADTAARNRDLEARLLSVIGPGSHDVLDLGSGSGANLWALAGLIPGPQTWTLVDNDPDLLARAVAPDGVAVRRWAADLSGDIGGLFAGKPTLVTASAFFDLCSTALIDRIVAETVRAGAVFYTVLTYDGREAWSPPHPEDDAVLQAFHNDQHSDKGLFGPASGPGATSVLQAAFLKAGYAVASASSDWKLSQAEDADLIEALAAGTAAAAAKTIGAPALGWGAARRNAQHVLIGHQDLLAWPKQS